MKRLLIYVSLCVWTSFCFADIEPPRTFSGSGIVVKVVDGDTIDVESRGEKERIRIIGIDTPETVDPRRPVECFGKEASAFAKKILDGKVVKLKSDHTQDNRDKYDRLLRYVWFENDSGEMVLFNLLMVQEGYAYEYTYDIPYEHQKAFKEAQKQAEKAQKGLWNPDTCGGQKTQKKSTSRAPAKKNTPKSAGSKFSCSPKKTCKQMSSCEEAYFFLNECGHKERDGDQDGVPCEKICPGG